MKIKNTALELTANTYRQNPNLSPDMLPLAEEEHIGAWRKHAEEAREKGTFQALNSRLPQFWFPIREGISKTDDYLSALKKGVKRELLPSATGLNLTNADELRLFIHNCPVSAIPVLFTPERIDFITLLRALAMRHEPEPVPDAVGAVMISGFNNWDRINTLHSAWKTAPQPKNSWAEEFRKIIAKKELYQDRILLLSGGFYGNVSPAEMGLSPETWRDISFKLRLEHECAHVLTYRLFNPAAKSLLDELIAESVSIIRTTGSFRPDWLFRFWDLANGQDGSDGLLGYYTNGAPPEVKRQTAALVRAAACNIQKISNHYGTDLKGQLATISHLVKYSLVDLAEKKDCY